MKKEISSKIIALTFGVLVLCFVVGFYALAVWQEPGDNPPNDNVSTPINEGDDDQGKSGGLWVGSFESHGQSQLDGNVGIKKVPSTYELDVNGTANVTELCFSGSNCESSWPAGGTGNPGGADGAVQFKSGTNFGGDAANFYWDNTNKRLGIGTSAFTSTDAVPKLVISQDGTEQPIQIEGEEDTYKEIRFRDTDNDRIWKWGHSPSNILSPTTGNYLGAWYYDGSNWIEPPYFTILNNGNIGIGTVSPGEKLDINGAMHLTPQVNPPADADEGDLYADTDHHLYYYNGSTWKQLDN